MIKANTLIFRCYFQSFKNKENQTERLAGIKRINQMKWT